MLSAKLVVFQLKQKATLPSTCHSCEIGSQNYLEVLCGRRPGVTPPCLPTDPVFPIPKGRSLQESKEIVWFEGFGLGFFFPWWGGGAPYLMQFNI